MSQASGAVNEGMTPLGPSDDPALAPVVAFCDFRLDRRLRQLQHDAVTVDLTPKLYQLIDHLLRHRDRVVPHRELRQLLWPATAVSDSSLSSLVGRLRALFEPRTDEIIKTHHRLGYRFIAACDAVHDPTEVVAETNGVAGRATSPPFVGRDVECAKLAEAFLRASDGRRQVVLIAGEQGVGKSRLVEQFCDGLDKAAVISLLGRAYHGGEADSLLVWKQIARQLQPQLDRDEMRALFAQRREDLVALLSELAESNVGESTPHGEAMQARFRLFDRAASLLRVAAAHAPVMIVLEDLHWADRASLLLLQFVARELDSARILLLATYRLPDAYDRQDLADLFVGLQTTPATQQLTLKGLSPSEVCALADALSGEAIGPALGERLFASSGGNPLFVGQLLQHLKDEGWLAQVRSNIDAWDRIGVPHLVRSLIEQRTRHLSADAERVLGVAAAIGREFDLALLVRVIAAGQGVAVSECLAAVFASLDEAVRARLIVEVSAQEGRYQFVQAMIHEGLHQRLSPAERSRWHWLIGEVLQAQLAEADPARAAVIANHFVLGIASGSADTALEQCVKAAEAANAAYAYAAAVWHYRRALQLVDLTAAAQARRATLSVALAETLARAGDKAATAPSAKEAYAVAAQLGDPQLMARAAIAHVMPLMGEFDPSVCAVLERALAALGPGDSILHAGLLARLATAHHFAPDRGVARDRFSREAVSMADRLDNRRTRLWTLGQRHDALTDPAHSVERLAIANSMVEMARQHGERDLLATAYARRAVDLTESGRLRSAATDMLALAKLADDLHDPILGWRSLVWCGMQASLQGRWDDAARFAQEAYASGMKLDQEYAPALLIGHLMTLNFTRGVVAANALDLVEENARRYPLMPAFRVMAARYLLEIGRREEARQRSEACLANGIDGILWDERWLATVLNLAMIYKALGDRARCEEFYAAILPYAHLVCISGFEGSVCYGATARFAGVLATFLERWQEAEQHFCTAITVHTEMEARPWLGVTYFQYGELLAARGRKHDHARIAELRAQAGEIARQLDMPWLKQQLGIAAPAP